LPTNNSQTKKIVVIIMELKAYIKMVQDLGRALNRIAKPKTFSEVDHLKLFQNALKAARAVSLEGLINQLETEINTIQENLAAFKQQRREILLQAAKAAEVPHKRYSDYDRITPFKISYRDKRVILEVGSERYKEVEEVDGQRLFEIIQENRALLENEPFDRGVFFHNLKQAYRLAREKLRPPDGWVPIRPLYSYLVLIKHVDLPDFIKKPEAKNFHHYSSSQFVYDLARFGRQEWSYGDEILRTRTPNMVTVASGQAVTLPNLNSVESPGPQLAVLKIEKRE